MQNFHGFLLLLSQFFLDFLFFIHGHDKKTKVFLQRIRGENENQKTPEIRQKIFSFL